MDNYYKRINTNLSHSNERKEIYFPLFFQKNSKNGRNPILLKEQFFNIKPYQTPNRIKQRNEINSLDVKDINYKDNHLYKRVTNPLEPTYKYDWQMTEVNQDRKINYIDFNKLGNHPKSIYPYKVNKNLDTYDIPGSQPNTTSLLSKLESKYGRKLQYEKDDIIGSHPGSLVKGIKTNRKTNPLSPEYPLIQGNSLEFGNEKNNKHEYDYKSLLDYYNKNSKIGSRNNSNILKRKHEISVNINSRPRNISILDGFGKDKKIYPREQYKNSKNNYKIFEKDFFDNYSEIV